MDSTIWSERNKNWLIWPMEQLGEHVDHNKKGKAALGNA